MSDEDSPRCFEYGNPKVNAIPESRCCGKPRGCRRTKDDGCVLDRHPWKRAIVYGDTTVRCQAMGVDPETHEQTQCVLLNGHVSPHVPGPLRVSP